MVCASCRSNEHTAVLDGGHGPWRGGTNRWALFWHTIDGTNPRSTSRVYALTSTKYEYSYSA